MAVVSHMLVAAIIHKSKQIMYKVSTCLYICTWCSKFTTHFGNLLVSKSKVFNIRNSVITVGDNESPTLNAFLFSIFFLHNKYASKY